MAAIRKRKNGSYEIRVSCGYGVDGKQHNQYRSYYPEPGMTPRQIEREVNKMAVLFEEECMRGQNNLGDKVPAICGAVVRGVREDQPQTDLVFTNETAHQACLYCHRSQAA